MQDDYHSWRNRRFLSKLKALQNHLMHAIHDIKIVHIENEEGMNCTHFQIKYLLDLYQQTPAEWNFIKSEL